MREVNRTLYEWDIELTDEYGDIIDHHWSDACPGIPDEGNLVLIKDVARGLPNHEDSFMLKYRAWAYVQDGRLPAEFDDGTKVPKRYHAELRRVLDAQIAERLAADIRESTN